MAGGRAAGLREWEWCRDELGLPSFPRDYPDTPAGRSWARAAAGNRKAAPGHSPQSFAPERWTVLRSAASLRIYAPSPSQPPVEVPSKTHRGAAAGTCNAADSSCSLFWQEGRPLLPEAGAYVKQAAAAEAQLRAFLKPVGKGRPAAGATIFMPEAATSQQKAAEVITDAPSGVSGKGPDQPIGLVTADGAGGVGRSAIGASSLCSSTALGHLRAQQPPSSWLPGSSVLVAYQNPGSSTVRRGSLRVCLELNELDCSPF